VITLTRCGYTYNAGRADALPALQDVSLTIRRGELIAVIGRNGSGKSTLARILSGALQPTAGSYGLADVAADAADRLWQIRRRVGLVFQRPDDQLIAASLIDDVAFGPENLALPPDEINRRVDAVLAALALSERASAAISELSAGEKQRTAVAGVLAMQPDCLILDEPTSMLNAAQARQVLQLARRLRDETGAAVLHVTHSMDEAVAVDRVLVFDRGRLVLDGPPAQVFASGDVLRAAGLVPPYVTEVAAALRAAGVTLPDVTLTAEALTGVMVPHAARQPRCVAAAAAQPAAAEVLVRAERIGFSYLAGTAQAAEAVRDVSFTLTRGGSVALIGSSQAGKSTLIDLLAGLRRPQHGRLYHADAPGADAEQTARALRSVSAVVFQQPDDQLVEPVVGMDVAIGPRRSGADPAQSRAIVADALTRVGLDYETFRLRYIHALSGGQRRRVALAGALAHRPQLLLLDEPGAGLDPLGRRELAGRLARLVADSGLTLVIAGAALDEFTLLADQFVILDEGCSSAQLNRTELLNALQARQLPGLELPPDLALIACYVDPAEILSAEWQDPRRFAEYLRNGHRAAAAGGTDGG
jgi:energy-coupling factor transport system ATP-binding protein